MFDMILVVLGLCAFEIISSIDNAVVNADVLGTIRDEKVKKFFLTWGIFFAIFVVRGVLPFVIFFAANANVGFANALTAMWSGDPAVKHAIEESSPLLLMGGGMFLLLLCLHWLFLEKKNFGLTLEEPLQRLGSIWFYSFASVLLPVTIMIAQRVVDPSKVTNLILAGTIGYCVFFITDGFKQNAEMMEERLMEGQTHDAGFSDWAKVLFLEIIDLTFSFDGVIGAFAFTLSVPLILLGNGLGAVIVRQLTVSNVDRIKKYDFLKNGAMYSIGFLGLMMVLEAFGVHIPTWGSPVITFIMIGYFFYRSVQKNIEQTTLQPQDAV